MTAPTVVLACLDLDRAISACQVVGFRLDAIGPADDPTWAELSMSGLTIVVDASLPHPTGDPVRLRLPSSGARWPADSGIAAAVELVGASAVATAAPEVPTTVASTVVSHETGGEWKEGRAGMRYRDLVPDRYGGAYIASHIHVPDGGPVPDYVHHHDIVHQLIFCHRGWVEVVYEDQGPPFVLRPGDCVLQPPGIRHRVLETSDDLFVVEVGCPAVHRTSVDHDLALPTGRLDPTRRFRGQRFARHVADDVGWDPVPGEDGAEQQPTDLAAASGGLVSVRRLRPGAAGCDLSHDEDFRLVFVTDGAARLAGADGTVVDLPEGSSATVPGGDGPRLTGSPGTVVLDVVASEPHRSASAG